jgi:type 1 glutamine amidotransferase
MLHRTTRLALAVGILVALAALIPALDATAAPAGKIKLLMIHNGGHSFEGFKKTMDPVLDTTGDFEVAVAESFDALKAENIKKFDVVLFYGSGGNMSDPAQEKGLEQFLQEGGGMVGVHATDAHKKSDVYWRLIGGRFTGHGGGSFMVRIEDKKHPVTAGMEDFEISDETYRNKYHPDFELHSLVRMDRGEEQQSMAWAQEIGKGRMFCTTLGHGNRAWQNPQFQRLVVRGLLWSAGREPKDP